MSSDQIKHSLHPRNRNRSPYDLKQLVDIKPELAQYVGTNRHGRESIDFADPLAVKLLNQAILHHYYGIEHWDFPEGRLCPPIPGRADYIHYIADLLESDGIKSAITCLDVGTGASSVYPVLGAVEYGWDFIASDIDQESLDSAAQIIDQNPILHDKVNLRYQKDAKRIFKGIIKRRDQIDVTICNPPFHSSIEEATKGTRRKVKNLRGKVKGKPQLNFGGAQNELVYSGGERQFIKQMISESKLFSRQVRWFTTLVSKQSNLPAIHKLLEYAQPKQVKTIDMGTGNKQSRIVAWTYR